MCRSTHRCSYELPAPRGKPESIKLMRHDDNETRIQTRVEMSERFYYWNPMDIDRYDLVVNTGVLDLDSCVDVIVAAYRVKIARATQTTA